MREARRPSQQALRQRLEAHERSALIARLRLVAAVAALAGVVAALVMTWDRLFPVSEVELLTVYWTHDCPCATPWIRSLESAGFVVRDFETENLHAVRKRLGTPDVLHGCHVASFTGYFIDGHVSAAALRRLAAERPVARGLALEADVSRHTYPLGSSGEALVLLDVRGGRHTPWPDLGAGEEH